ncbi:RNA-binding domain-containing protein [Nitrososphaera sp.]|uniref:RNA-binding domain-containing protein n=1 Tax=Nitrososphaera sp. TaxID=1971748 RepID=UPI00307F4093
MPNPHHHQQQEEPRFSGAEVNLVLHATEDREKVLAAVEAALGVSGFEEEASEGHFGNRILLLRANVANSRQAGELFARIASALNSPDRQHLADYIDEYSDERGNLYLRLDKQRLCSNGRVALAESDAVRIKFKPVRRYQPSGNVSSYRGLFSSSTG